jgi:hypothetical protein
MIYRKSKEERQKVKKRAVKSRLKKLELLVWFQTCLLTKRFGNGLGFLSEIKTLFYCKKV